MLSDKSISCIPVLRALAHHQGTITANDGSLHPPAKLIGMSRESFVFQTNTLSPEYLAGFQIGIGERLLLRLKSGDMPAFVPTIGESYFLQGCDPYPSQWVRVRGYNEPNGMLFVTCGDSDDHFQVPAECVFDSEQAAHRSCASTSRLVSPSRPTTLDFRV